MTPTLAALRRSIDVIGTPMTILDLEGRIEHINPANEQLLGRSADELRGRSISVVLPADPDGRFEELFATLLREGRLQGVFRNVRPDGSTVPVEITAEVVSGASGTPHLIVASIRDLGPQMRQFEHLSASALGLVAGEGEDVLEATVRVARTLLGARYAALGVVDEGRLVRFIPSGLTEAEIGAISHWPTGRGLLGAMISEKRTIRLRDLGGDPRSSGFPKGHPSMRSFLGTPIRIDDEIFGHLYFTDKLDPPEFSFVDERLAELFAAHAAVAIRADHQRLALEASERSLAEAQRIAHIGSWERDVATGVLRWSEESHRIFGLELGTFAGTVEDFLAFVHPEDRAKAAPSPAQLAAADPATVEYRIIRADGAVRILHEEAVVSRDATGNPVRYAGTTQDITERVAAEAAQVRLARLLDQSSSEIYVFEAETLRFIEVNAGALRNIGYTLDELRDLTPLALKPGLSPDSFAALLEPLLAGDRDQVAFETIHRRKDGSTYPVEVRLELLLSETPSIFVAVIEDITERVAAQEERARLAVAVEQAGDSIMVLGQDLSITYVNPSFSRLYGYSTAEIIGQHVRALDGGRPGPTDWAELKASLAGGHSWSGLIVNRRRDGSLVEVESVISPVRDAAGRPAGYIQVDRDVTRERALEGALERDARDRETIEAALERIDPAASPEEIAAAACGEIARLAGIDAAWAIELGDGQGLLLAADELTSQAFRPGLRIPEARARLLLERAAGGPWTEGGQPQFVDGSLGEKFVSMGLEAIAYAPLKGAHGILGVIAVGARDPADAERLIERLPALATFGSIVGALIAPGLETRHREDAARAGIRAILDERAFGPFFQPIVELRTGVVVGYEALSRFTDGRRPDMVFAQAARSGLGVELELATLREAVAAAAVLPPEAYLSLNVSPELIGSDELKPALAGLDRPVVLEVTEHVVIDDYVALRRDLRALGRTVRLAVDDAGAGYASLRHILELRPDFVKLDIGLMRRIDGDPARQALIAGIGYFALKRKVRLIAEGIETLAELETLRGLGVTHGQGYLMGRPADGRGPGPWLSLIQLPA